MPPTARLLSTLAAGPVIVLTGGEAAGSARAAALEAAGATVVTLEAGDLKASMQRLTQFGIQSLVLEGGAALHASAWDAGVVDFVQMYVAPVSLGARGVPVLPGRGFSVEALVESSTIQLGPDTLSSKVMFTGLIEDVGRVSRIDRFEDGARIEVDTTLAAELSAGDSLAVNGVCLTVTPLAKGKVRADVGSETMRVTTLGLLEAGRAVNLERSMRADGRFGGHFVQGHVDATGVLESLRIEGESRWLTVSFPPEFAPYFIPKGAVAVDGVSLTIAELRPAQFSVMIVPFTWQATNLSDLRPGDRVNLECDMIGKYVVRNITRT